MPEIGGLASFASQRRPCPTWIWFWAPDLSFMLTSWEMEVMVAQGIEFLPPTRETWIGCAAPHIGWPCLGHVGIWGVNQQRACSLKYGARSVQHSTSLPLFFHPSFTRHGPWLLPDFEQYFHLQNIFCLTVGHLCKVSLVFWLLPYRNLFWWQSSL